jgi:16S rRNA processing protein RimM
MPSPKSDIKPHTQCPEKPLQKKITTSHTEENQTDAVLLGKFGRAHGIRGEILFDFFGEDPKILAKSKLLLKDPKSTFTRDIVITSLRPHQKGLILSLEGILTRTDAEALVGSELFIKRDSLPEIAEDELYLHDLMGIKVLDSSGQLIGSVIKLLDTQEIPILIIKRANGSELYLPFTDSFILEIDLNERFLRTLREDELDNLHF